MSAPAYFHNDQPITRDAFYAIACDPRRSVAVEACAGAGKTWMLVSRILRALIEPAPGSADGARVSMRGNYEVCLQFFSRPLAARMEEIFANDLTTARRLTIDEWEKRSILTRVGEMLLGPFEPLV